MTTYSISLDDVDLALLPTRSYCNDFLKKDLFEFQLLAREEEKDVPTYPNYTCHVCALEVPAPFLNEHVASAKHQANVRITTEASQRMRALITAPPPPLTPRATERFCDSCTCIVGKDHEKTKEHRLSVIQDRMLCDLAKLYIGDEDLNDVKENEKKNDKDKKHLNDVDKVMTKDIPKVDHNVAKITNTGINKTGQKQNAFKTKAINNKPTTEQETLYGHCTEFVKFNLPIYIKILNKATSSPKIDIRPVGDKIYIIVNNERIIVPYDHFNGYLRTGSKIYCNLCEHSFEEAYEEVHKLSVAHVTSVMGVVDDSHCIREKHDWWSHCILCNEIVWNSEVEEHKHTQKHIEEKREATVPQVQADNKQENISNALANMPKVQFTNTTVPNQTLPQNVAQILPDFKPKNITVPNQNLPQNAAKNIAEVKPKNITVPTPKLTKPAVNISELNAKNKSVPNNNTPQSAASKKQELKGKIKPNENQVTIVSQVYGDSKDDINYPYTEESISSVRCVICDCAVPIYYNNRIDHLNGNRHAVNLKKQFPPIE